jgi:hypothetical protein
MKNRYCTVSGEAAHGFQRGFNRRLVRDPREQFVRSGFRTDRNLHQPSMFQAREQTIFHSSNTPAHRRCDPAKPGMQPTRDQGVTELNEPRSTQEEIAVIKLLPIGALSEPELDIRDHPVDRQTEPSVA